MILRFDRCPWETSETNPDPDGTGFDDCAGCPARGPDCGSIWRDETGKEYTGAERDRAHRLTQANDGVR